MTHFATCLQVYGISVDDGLPFNGTYNAMVFHLRIDMLFACGLHDHGYELSAPVSQYRIQKYLNTGFGPRENAHKPAKNLFSNEEGHSIYTNNNRIEQKWH